MSDTHHHAIIVTIRGYATTRPDRRFGGVESARSLEERGELARHLRGCALAIGALVSELSQSSVNDYMSFVVFPSGSKDDRPESDKGAHQRDQIVEILESWKDIEGGSPVQWVEVEYGGDEQFSAQVRRFSSKLP